MGGKAATVHAAAVLAGPRAILIRGPAGAGKSRLALALIQAAQCRLITFARLVGDDRIELAAAHGRLLARAPRALAGLLEVRGLGIRRLDYEPVAVVGLVVDLATPAAERLPAAAEQQVEVAGIILPRLAIGPGLDPTPAVLARLLTANAEL
ncbi:MAG TPA: HPr kinase/phosphatase C-terminal domain-containing protein [Xanthobacteraceae bacterium]|jgi:serine kinase of HPr protein (carbohydrate metabolism regulator)